MPEDQEPRSKIPITRLKWTLFDIIGILLVVLSIVLLFLAPDSLSQLFDTIIKDVKSVVVDTFLTGEVGIAVIVSVIIGRILERMGFTDGLIRILIPIMKVMKIPM